MVGKDTGRFRVLGLGFGVKEPETKFDIFFYAMLDKSTQKG
jgi:hypothetical protein